MDNRNQKFAYFPANKEELHELLSVTYIDLSSVDISKVDDLSYLFKDTKRTVYKGIEHWNVSHVKNMAGMFSGAEEFNADISLWDTSCVEDMSYMFENAKKFNQTLNRWNVSKVENMAGMFSGAKRFNGYIEDWDTSNVENMSKMFSEAESYNQKLLKWNVSNVKDMSYMFHKAYAFNQDLYTWNVSNVENMAGMFHMALNFNKNICTWKLDTIPCGYLCPEYVLSSEQFGNRTFFPCSVFLALLLVNCREVVFVTLSAHLFRQVGVLRYGKNTNMNDLLPDLQM